MNADFPKKIIITMDTDWCPSYVLSYALSIFKGLPVTVFATNKYPNNIFSKNIEIGIHPNLEFLPKFNKISLDSVFDPLLSIYPKCRICRTHKLFWFSFLEEYLISKKILIDSSLQIFSNSPMIGFSPSGLIRYPILWSDGLFINYNLNLNPEIIQFPINVISVHPIHLWLNTSKISEYNSFKEEVPILENVSKEVMERYFRLGTNRKIGIRKIITNFLNSTDSKLFSFFPISNG